MRIGHTLFAHPALEIWTGHLASNRSGPDQCDLRHQVIKLLWVVSRERSHLRPRLNLKHADGVGISDHVVYIRAVLGKMGPIDVLSIVIPDKANRVLEYSHHAQSEQVNFDNAEIGAIIFVPLHHNSTRHGRRFQRYNGIERPLANHHPTGMLAKMTREVLHLAAEVEVLGNARVREVETGAGEVVFKSILRSTPLPAAKP